MTKLASAAAMGDVVAGLLPIDNEPRDYAWGIPGGISRLLGRPESKRREAELWLGAHPSSPSTIRTSAPWGDLAAWESDHVALPYLMKLLAAAEPLSLQAHPTEEQARAGFAAENAAGVPVGATHRNYKDPHAKPELIIAISDGFEALCGFRDPAHTRRILMEIAACWPETATGLDALAEQLKNPTGLSAAFRWLLDGEDDVRELTRRLCEASGADPTRFPLVTRLTTSHPNDPGVIAALLLNHVRLSPGECLWLPAGNIHAYLTGIGVELMGPSDNVLRGGLTPKHIDVDELVRVLDWSPTQPPLLRATAIAPHVRVYRPADLPTGQGVGFLAMHVDGDARVELRTGSLIAVVAGQFSVHDRDGARDVGPGDFFLVTTNTTVTFLGEGSAFIAAPEPDDA